MGKTLSMVALLAASLISQVAWSKNFFSSKLKFELTHSSAYSKTKSVAKTKAQLVMSDDHENWTGASFCELKIKGTVYDCSGRIYDRKNYVLYLDSATLKTILIKEMGVSPDRISTMKLDEASFALSRQSDEAGIRRYGKKLKLQIHTDRESESYHLIAGATRAKKL